MPEELLAYFASWRETSLSPNASLETRRESPCMERIKESGVFGLLLAGLFLALLGGSSFLASWLDVQTALAGGVALVVVLVVFFKTEYAIYLLILSTLLSPEFGFGSTGGSSMGRGVTFRFEDVLVLLVGASWLIKNAIFKDLGILRRTSLNNPMWFYIFACTVATLWGVVQGRVGWMTGSLFVAKYVQYFVIFFLVINTIRREDQIRRYWNLMLATAVIVGLVSFSQIASGQRVSAPFEGAQPEPNTFGGYLAFLVLICFALFLYARDWKARLLYLGLTGFLMVPLMYTLSRSSYLAVLAGVPILLILQRKNIMTYALLGGLLLLAAFPQVFLPRAVVERVAFTWSQPKTRSAHQAEVMGQRIDSSTSARLASFSEAISDFVKKPILGYGVTGWHFIDSQLFRTLVETGLVGFGAFIFLLSRIFQLGMDRWRRFRGDPFYGGLSAGFLAGLVGLFFHSFGSNTFIIVRVMEPFWIVAGLVFMTAWVNVERRTGKPILARDSNLRARQRGDHAPQPSPWQTLAQPVAAGNQTRRLNLSSSSP